MCPTVLEISRIVVFGMVEKTKIPVPCTFCSRDSRRFPPPPEISQESARNTRRSLGQYMFVLARYGKGRSAPVLCGNHRSRCQSAGDQDRRNSAIANAQKLQGATEDSYESFSFRFLSSDVFYRTLLTQRTLNRNAP